MMTIFFAFWLSQSILIPIVIYLIRIRGWVIIYWPFFLLLLLGFVDELSSFFFINNLKRSNAPVVNVFSLLECCLILYQLHIWGNKKAGNWPFYFFTGLCVFVWIVDNIAFLNLNAFSPYFRIFYAFIIVLLSINQINALMVKPNGVLYKSPRFIISLGFVIFFIYQIIYEASFYIGSDKSIIANKIIFGFSYINLMVNLLYSVAVFLITGKHKTGDINYFSEN